MNVHDQALATIGATDPAAPAAPQVSLVNRVFEFGNNQYIASPVMFVLGLAGAYGTWKLFKKHHPLASGALGLASLVPLYTGVKGQWPQPIANLIAPAPPPPAA